MALRARFLDRPVPLYLILIVLDGGLIPPAPPEKLSAVGERLNTGGSVCPWSEPLAKERHTESTK